MKMLVMLTTIRLLDTVAVAVVVAAAAAGRANLLLEWYYGRSREGLGLGATTSRAVGLLERYCTAGFGLLLVFGGHGRRRRRRRRLCLCRWCWCVVWMEVR